MVKERKTRYGWTTVQCKSEYYRALSSAYELKQKDLLDEDIRTLNAYINEKILKGIALQELTGRFKVSDYGEKEIIVSDRYLKKNFSVVLREGKLVCETDELIDDVHKFFVKHDPRVIEILKDKGLNPSEV